jgi:hypothetical protein
MLVINFIILKIFWNNTKSINDFSAEFYFLELFKIIFYLDNLFWFFLAPTLEISVLSPLKGGNLFSMNLIFEKGDRWEYVFSVVF